MKKVQAVRLLRAAVRGESSAARALAADLGIRKRGEAALARGDDASARYQHGIEVGLRVNLWQLVSLNDDTELFKLRFDLVLEWEDPLLCHVRSRIVLMDGKSLTGVVRRDDEAYAVTGVQSRADQDMEGYELVLPMASVHHIETPGLDTAWTPLGKFAMTNVVSETVLLQSPIELLDGRTGKVRIFMKYVSEFKSALDFRSFPFDQQHLKVFFMASVPPSIMKFKDLQESKLRIWNEEGNAWFVEKEKPSADHPECFYVQSEPPDTRYRREAHSKAVMQLVVTRRTGFYVWNYISIVFVLTLLSFGSFAVPVTDVAGRSSITIALLLTAVSFKHLMASRLPVKPYRHALENYITFSFALLCVPTFEQVILLRGWCRRDDRSDLSISSPNQRAIFAGKMETESGYECVDRIHEVDLQLAWALAAIWTAFNAWCLLVWLPGRSSRCQKRQVVISWTYLILLIALGACWCLAAYWKWFGDSVFPYWAALPPVFAVPVIVKMVNKLCKQRRR